MAQVLIDHGWKNVHPVYGGFDAWQQAGLPVEPKRGGQSESDGGTAEA